MATYVFAVKLGLALVMFVAENWPHRKSNANSTTSSFWARLSIEQQRNYRSSSEYPKYKENLSKLHTAAPHKLRIEDNRNAINDEPKKTLASSTFYDETTVKINFSSTVL